MSYLLYLSIVKDGKVCRNKAWDNFLDTADSQPDKWEYLRLKLEQDYSATLILTVQSPHSWIEFSNKETAMQFLLEWT